MLLRRYPSGAAWRVTPLHIETALLNSLFAAVRRDEAGNWREGVTMSKDAGAAPSGWSRPESPWREGELVAQERVGVTERMESQGCRSIRDYMPECVFRRM